MEEGAGEEGGEMRLPRRLLTKVESTGGEEEDPSTILPEEVEGERAEGAAAAGISSGGEGIDMVSRLGRTMVFR